MFRALMLTQIDRRTCKHLRKYRGEEAEQARLGSALPQSPTKKTAEGEEDAASGPPILLAQSWDNDAVLLAAIVGVMTALFLLLLAAFRYVRVRTSRMITE